MHRRELLKYGLATGGLSFLQFGSRAWAVQNEKAGPERLIVVFLRGAVDGLNVVAPYTDHDYYSLRPTIALARPGQNNGVLDLDGRFGLHPALAPLMPLWKERSLAFIHACGSPSESRSHFEAQNFMESGTPGVSSTPDGWMNRLLATLPGKHTPTEAINFGKTVPKILSGSMPVASISTKDYEAHPERVQDPIIGATFDRMYSGGDAVSVAYQQGRAARSQLMNDLAKDMTEAANGAPSAKGFPEDVAKLCTLMRNDPTVQLGFFGLSGWDTHVKQGGAEGQLANHLHPLAQGLAALRTGLGSGYGKTIVLVVSEFGRTAKENGSGGTDHGHGNALWVMGGPVIGGKVYGDWPGIDEESLHEQRDLAITTDFRSAIGSVVQRHLKLTPQQMGAIFPGAPQSGQGKLNIARA